MRIYKEGEIMSQSNYEKYAVIKQQELLHKERNLQQAISCLRDRRKFASLQSIDSAIDFVADLYDLSSLSDFTDSDLVFVSALSAGEGFKKIMAAITPAAITKRINITIRMIFAAPVFF